MLHTYALEPYHNIIINDLDDIGLELLEYRGDEPIYLLYHVDSAEYTNLLRMKDENKLCYNDEYPMGIPLKDISFLQNIDQVEDTSTIFTLDPGDKTWYKATKIEYGMTVGYRLTELTYAGTLISSIGESITSVLDKIKNMLGEFEYFYDLNGRFIFQRKKNYINSIFNNITQVEDDMYVNNSVHSDQFVYKFEGGNLITSYQNSPNLSNLKNDFSIWGNRKGISGADIPIHYRYAIDKKPIYYKTYDSKVYYASVEEAQEDYGSLAAVNEALNAKEIDISDWRELIYQMALDYYKYNQKDDFLSKIENNNKRLSSSNSLYPGGTTGYERYYIDIQGFWRELYNPYPSAIYISSPNITIDNELYHFTEESNDLFTHFKYRLYNSESDKDKTAVKVLWGDDEGYSHVFNANAANHSNYYIYDNTCYVEGNDVAKYIVKYYQIPENTWNQYTWDATNLDVFKKYYYEQKYNLVVNPTQNNINNYYIKNPDQYVAVGINDYYLQEKEYYIMEYKKIESHTSTQFKNRKVNWYIILNGDYKLATTYKTTTIYYTLEYTKLDTSIVVENFAENKLKYFTKLPDTYTKAESFTAGKEYYVLEYITPESFNINTMYYYKTYVLETEQEELNGQIIYKLIIDDTKVIKPIDIKLPFNKEYFSYIRKNIVQLQPLIDTIEVVYDFTEEKNISDLYYVTTAITPQNKSGFTALTKDNAPYVSKQELYQKDLSVETIEEYVQVASENSYNENTIYYERDPGGYKIITFASKEEFNPKKNEYFIDVDGVKQQLSTNAIYDNSKTYYIATYKKIQLDTEEEKQSFKEGFKDNYTKYYVLQEIYSYKTLLELREKFDDEIWIIDETDYVNYYPFLTVKTIDENTKEIEKAEWLESIPKLAKLFIKEDGDNIYVKNSILTNYLGLDGKIDETKTAVTSYLDFYEEDYDYFIEGENRAWNKKVIEAPDTLNFWMEFLDTEGELSQFSINAVGDRSKVVNDKDVKSIYFRTVPEIIFIDSESLLEEEINETNYRHYTKIRNIPMNLFSISAQGKSAQDALDSLLYQHSYCIESITLQAIPIYYLEPNTRILVYDDMSKINGEYLVSKISLPLAYNGTMTINATKAPTRLY